MVSLLSLSDGGPRMMQGGMGGWFGLRVTPMNLSIDILVG